MFKYIIGSVAVLLTTSISFAETTVKPFGCTTRENIEKLLNDGDFIPFSKGTTPDNKFHEIWLNVKGQITVVSYAKPKDDNSKSIGEVCVISMTNDEVYNGTTVEMLNKAFTAQEGQKL
jgi:hypothetical protein